MMKMQVKRGMLVGVLCCAGGAAASLFDIAPSIAPSQSEQLRYDVYARLGYDDNVNATPSDEESALFTRLGFSASQSDYSSLTQVTWTAQLGATIFDKSADNTNQECFADCAGMVHLLTRFDARSSNAFTARLSFTPELDYTNGMSSANRMGESLNWLISDAYSHAISSLQSITIRGSYSGNMYLDELYRNDNRQYCSLGLTLTHQYSSLTSFNTSVSTQYDIREEGYNSSNLYWMVGLQSALSPLSSVGLNVGLQLKHVHGESHVYPNVNAAYRYQLRQRTRVSCFASFTNENLETYIPYIVLDGELAPGGNYLSNNALRLGCQLEHQLNDRWGVDVGAFAIYSQYGRATNPYLRDRDELTYYLKAACRYQFHPRMGVSLWYTYTIANEDAGDYRRNTISAGVDYSF